MARSRAVLLRRALHTPLNLSGAASCKLKQLAYLPELCVRVTDRGCCSQSMLHICILVVALVVHLFGIDLTGEMLTFFDWKYL